MPIETSFSITPVEGGVPVAPGTQPNYIQFRFNGVDLGGPDATVVDFVGDALVVVRGTGPTADVVTVSFG
jgi:hypothetical protein